jgi:hypothetical protein
VGKNMEKIVIAGTIAGALIASSTWEMAVSLL